MPEEKEGTDVSSVPGPGGDDTIQRLINDLHVIQGAEREGDGDVTILSIPLPLTSEDEPAKQSIQIMHPTRPITRGAVWERTKSTWNTSRCIDDFSDISDRSIAATMIVLRFGDIDYIVVVLPVCTASANVTLHQEAGALCAAVDQFKLPTASEYRTLIAVGPTRKLHKLIRACFQRVRIDQKSHSLNLYRPSSSPLLGIRGLGFCSWEALGAGQQRPSLPIMIATLQKIEERAPSCLSSVLIDDGWQQISTDEQGKRRLTSFDLDASLISESGHASDLEKDNRLLQYVQALRKAFPDVENYGVWMTLAGYWDGLDPAYFSSPYGPLLEAKLMNPFLDNGGYSWWLPAVDRLDAFYNEYFRFLRQSGISFVKVDDQADWEWIQILSGSVVAPSVYYDKAWRAMTSAAERHFGDMCVIHSMSQGHRFIKYQTKSLPGLHLGRNSDDLFSKVPRSHVSHIYQNSLNTCLTSGSGSILPDADMITSRMLSESLWVEWADYHAAYRACFSASTIWLSDGVETSNESRDGVVLDRLLAPSKDVTKSDSLGRLQAVQITSPSEGALPLPESIFLNLTEEVEGPALKMSSRWNTKSRALSGAVLSLWNTRYSTKSVDCITEADLCHALGVTADKRHTSTPYIVFTAHPQKQVALVHLPPMRQGKAYQSIIPVTLEPGAYSVFAIVPALPLNLDPVVSWDDGVIACVGLIDKYNGLMAADRIESRSPHDDDVVLCSFLSRAGRCGFVLQSSVGTDPTHKWTAKIDGVTVQKDDISIEPIDEQFTLLVVDMVKHLRSANSSDVRNKTHWQIDLVKRTS